MKRKWFVGGFIVFFLLVSIGSVVALGDFEQHLLNMEQEITVALEAGDTIRAVEIQESYIATLNLYREVFGVNPDVWNTFTEQSPAGEYNVAIWVNTVNEARSAMPSIGQNVARYYSCDANCQNVSNVIERLSPPYMASWVVYSTVEGESATYFNANSTASVTFWCAGGVASGNCVVEKVTMYQPGTNAVELFMDELALVTYLHADL